MLVPRLRSGQAQTTRLARRKRREEGWREGVGNIELDSGAWPGWGGRGKRCRNHRENFRDVFAFFFTSRKACMKKMANGSMRVCGLCAGRGLRQDWGAYFRKLRGRAGGKCNEACASVVGSGSVCVPPR
jgi:hypothetical protein